MIEILLLLAVLVLAAQVIILQCHYTEKLSEQAVVLNYLLDILVDESVNVKQLEQLKDKIFNSSQ